MSDMQEIDRSLVAIFDLEGFSRRNNPQQAHLVENFVKILDEQLESLSFFEPDAFSTGDGAIVAVGRGCKVDKSTVKAFLDFVITFMSRLLKEGIIIRTAVHYSEKDSIIPLTNSRFIKGEYIQIGDTINIATRILTFCEPCELMISHGFYTLLRKYDLEEIHEFHENQEFVTKHQIFLKTYTYKPPKKDKEFFYSPDSALHVFKKYSYFPPVDTKTLQYFMDNGLGMELDIVVSNAYNSWRFLSDTRSFLSWNTVLGVLCQLQYDPLDTVYVLSRNDIEGFWDQNKTEQYLQCLKARTSDKHPYINQTRVMIYNKSVGKQTIPPGNVYYSLKELHKPESLFHLSSEIFKCKFPMLADLRFGFTLSRNHKYAVIPIPAPEGIEAQQFWPDRIQQLLKPYEKYEESYGPMKAIITANPKYISELVKQMEKLLKDVDVVCPDNQ
jgi:hypothetical protein